jgi:leucyl aminopeptidase
MSNLGFNFIPLSEEILGNENSSDSEDNIGSAASTSGKERATVKKTGKESGKKRKAASSTSGKRLTRRTGTVGLTQQEIHKKTVENLREKIREEEKEKKKSKLMTSLPESDDLEVTLVDSE